MSSDTPNWLQATYRDHLGNVLVCGDGGGLYIDDNDLHDWSATYDSGTVLRKTTIHSLKLVVWMPDGDYSQLADAATDLFAHDIDAGIPGTLTLNGWSVRCYVTSSANDMWWVNDGLLEKQLKLTMPNPTWRRETIKEFRIDSSVDWSTDRPDYPWDYPRGYRPDPAVRVIDNPSSSESLLGLVIYGPVTDPAVRVGDNHYIVNVEVPARNYLLIDPIERIIHLVGEDGSLTNAFRYRDRGAVGSGHYIFAPVPAGTQTVAFDNSFAFDAYLIEERGEPTWS